MRTPHQLTWGVSESLALTRSHVDSLCHCRVFPSAPSGTPRPHPHRPNLPISPWARYGESDDDVLEQMLQGRLCQEMGAKLSRQRGKIKSQTRSRVGLRLWGTQAAMCCVTSTLVKSSWSNQKLVHRYLLMTQATTKPRTMKHFRFSRQSQTKAHTVHKCTINGWYWL